MNSAMTMKWFSMVAGVLMGSLINVGCKKGQSSKEVVEYRARKEIQFLAMCIDAYLDKYGEMPASAFEATIEFQEYVPAKWIEDNKAVDPWGEEYNYEATNRGFTIWSSGSNRVDEKGLGDDIRRDVLR